VTAPILAIDVTGPGGGAALALDDRIEVGLIPPAVARGRDLVPQIQDLLDRAGIKLADLGAIACAVGPGSFTGIRIGIATAATLAYAAELPVTAIGSLHGIAAGAPEQAHSVAIALDARREHVYSARFVRRDGALVADGEYRHLPAAELARDLDPETYLLGDARTAYPTLFDRFAGSEDAPVRPDVIARLGGNALDRGETTKPSELRPLYLRLSDPELRRPQPRPDSSSR
jgi:tRNA threonylcarbamoyladenosine biosynthesis protein TsaB